MTQNNIDPERVRDWCHVIETTMTEVEEAVANCSQCLKTVKNLRTHSVSDCSSLAYWDNLTPNRVSPLGDNTQYDALEQKLKLEEERHKATHSFVEDLNLQLETCKEDLKKAEKDRAAAMVYRAEFDALKKRLSAKDREVSDLSSELSQRERELRQTDKDRMKSRSPHGAECCKECGSVPKLLSVRPLAQKAVQAAQSSLIPQQNFLLEAREEAENIYHLEIAALHNKIQSFEQEAEEWERHCTLLEQALQDEIDQRGGEQLGVTTDTNISASEPTAPGAEEQLESKTSMRYRRSHQKLLYMLSTIVALVAIVISYTLEPKTLYDNARYTRPGWARHRNEGWQYLQG
ncbi:hypothetical protein BGW80DRAFT_1321506 [Lactifluus volemus]|nr:hypothetical protein BGW80DRAFT_1321506 [Lactifluus volemus]